MIIAAAAVAGYLLIRRSARASGVAGGPSGAGEQIPRPTEGVDGAAPAGSIPCWPWLQIPCTGGTDTGIPPAEGDGGLTLPEGQTSGEMAADESSGTAEPAPDAPADAAPTADTSTPAAIDGSGGEINVMSADDWERYLAGGAGGYWSGDF